MSNDGFWKWQEKALTRPSCFRALTHLVVHVMTHAGKRVAIREALGTVRYQGPVDGTSGIWLGIDWDDPLRGKHDGSKDGKRYFSCR